MESNILFKNYLQSLEQKYNAVCFDIDGTLTAEGSKNIDRISKLLSNSDGLVCNSEYMRDYYLSKYPKDQNKVFSVKNIIDVYDIRNQGKKPIEDQDFTTFRDNHEFLIVSVGRFCAEKAFENLIAAFAECIRKKKGLGLVLVGDGEYRNTYIQIIRKKGITDDVYFTGFQSNPYQFMCKCDFTFNVVDIVFFFILDRECVLPGEDFLFDK